MTKEEIQNKLMGIYQSNNYQTSDLVKVILDHKVEFDQLTVMSQTIKIKDTYIKELNDLLDEILKEYVDPPKKKTPTINNPFTGSCLDR